MCWAQGRWLIHIQPPKDHSLITLARGASAAVSAQPRAFSILQWLSMCITMHMQILSRTCMKTERVTLLTSPDFKAFLNAEAHREGVSVAELVRTRCERRPSDEDAMLAELTRELQQSMVAAKRALKGGLDEAQSIFSELSLQRRDAASLPSEVKAAVKPPVIKTPKRAGANVPKRAVALHKRAGARV